MNLEIRPNGSKYWRLSYRYQRKQKTLALGVYPVVSLADARVLRLDAKKLLQQRIDPAMFKRQEIINTHEHSFIKIAEQWHKKESGRWSKDHATRVWQSLKADALPHLGDIPVKDIRAPEVLYVIRKIEGRGALDVASRIKQRIGAIMRYATYMGIIDYNPVEALKDVIQTRNVQHRKAIKFEDPLKEDTACQ